MVSPPLTGSSVVVRGSFNPAIFHPSWFAREGLISAEEADDAVLNVIHPQISSFETAGFSLQVTPEVFEVTAAGRPFTDLVRDIAYGTFKILRHTPITVMGMNNFQHFQAGSEDAWHHIGHHFAPKEFWSPLLKNPGMQSLTIRGQRPDDLLGYIDVRVEPSTLISPAGVYVYVNDHVQVTQGQDPEGTGRLMDILDNKWDQAVQHAEQIIDAVRKEAE